MFRSIAVLLAAFILFGCGGGDNFQASNASGTKSEFPEYRVAMKKVERFFAPMGKPAKYDWLGSHNEQGQTFDEYLGEKPSRPMKEKRKIYVLPLGTFTAQQKQIIGVTAGYLEAFFGLPVSVMPAKVIPPSRKATDSRQSSPGNKRRLRTGYFLDEVLPKLLPPDGAALIAFTPEDLYPDASMNYVFGQASFDKNVGIWSLFRLKENADYGLLLRRMIKIAAHETGHMFSIRHCTKYECLMSGTNHLGETDRRPIDACPECSAKIWWLTNAEPSARYAQLADFCRKNGLAGEAEEFSKKAAAVK